MLLTKRAGNGYNYYIVALLDLPTSFWLPVIEIVFFAEEYP